MSDSRLLGTGAFGPEPAHDPELGALVRDAVGDVPHTAVDWAVLAARIGERARAQVSAPWWSYAARWERRVIPLALAAGIAAAAVLSMSTSGPSTWPAASPLISASALATAVASGTPADDAASQFARSITNAADLSAGVPE